MKACHALIFLILFGALAYAGAQYNLYSSTIVYHWANDSAAPLRDAVRNKLNMTEITTTPVTWGLTGKVGTAIGLNSTDRLKYVNNARLARNQTKWTLAFWLKNYANGTGYIISSNLTNTAQGQTQLWYNNAGNFALLFYHYCSATSANTFFINNFRRFGGWHHYALVFYRNGTDNVEYWIDGQNQTGIYAPNSSTFTCGKSPSYNISRFTIGEHLGTGSLDMRIDEIGYYDAALNASEIGYLYANGTPTTANTFPFGYSSTAHPVVTIAYPNATRHYNDLTYNGSIILTTDITANCTINDTDFYLSRATATMHRWRNATTLTDGNHSIAYACNNTGWTNSTFWFILDRTKPAILQNSPANLTRTRTYFTLNVSFSDTYLYWANTTIKQSNGTMRYNKYSGNLNTTHVTLYNWQKQINITGWPDGNYTILHEARDTHTLQKWDMPLLETKKTYSTAQVRQAQVKGGKVGPSAVLAHSVSYDLAGSTFKIELPEDIEVTAEKALDRFRFKYTGSKGQKSFTVAADRLDYLENSPFPCHFIVDGLYWFDCAGLPSAQVNKIDAKSYIITYEQDRGSITTDSLGGLNYASKTYNLTVDTTAPTFVAHKSWPTSSTIVFNFNTSEVTNYTYGLGTTDCLVHDKANGSSLGFFQDHTLIFSSLNYNTTYYLNVTVWDQAGNSAKRCFLVNTTSAALSVTSVRLVVDGNHFVGYSNATHGTGNNISYECRFYVNATLLENFTYPTPQYIATPASIYYQEQADSYFQDTPNPWIDLPRVFDNDYSTDSETSAPYQASSAIITYYKPDGYVNQPVTWQVKDGATGSAGKVNHTLPSACQPDALNYITLRVYQRRQDTDPYHDNTHWICCHEPTCTNGTLLRIGGPYGLAYEEGVFWVANATLLNTVEQGIERNVGNLTPTGPGTYYMACRITDGFINSTWRNTTGLSIPAFNITIRDENTLGQISGVNFSVDVISQAANWSDTYSTGNGFLNFSLLPVLGAYTLRFYSDSHYMRVASLDLGATLIQNLNVYALANNMSTALDVYVRDPNYLGIENATVHLLRYYANLTSWIEVSQEQTNPGGKVRFYVLPANAYYKFVVTYGNMTIFESNGEKILATTYIISTSIEPIYETYESVDAEIQVINTTLPPYFKLAYANKKEKIYQVCMDTYRSTDAGLMLFNSTCLTTSSGVIIHPFNENYSYTAYGYTTYYHSPDIYFAQAAYSALADFFKGIVDMKDLGIILSILIFITLTIGTLFLTGSPVVLIIALDVALLAVRFLHLFNVSDIALGIIIPASFIVAYYLNKVTY